MEARRKGEMRNNTISEPMTITEPEITSEERFITNCYFAYLTCLNIRDRMQGNR